MTKTDACSSGRASPVQPVPSPSRPSKRLAMPWLLKRGQAVDMWAPLRRAMATRDRHCRFPGCTNPVAAWHHIRHWADGGPTDRANLIGLCGRHHSLVHDDGFVISTTGDQTFRFYRPDGQAIPESPE